MKKILVWDWPVRVLHWMMVLLFTGLIITGKGDGDNMDWHFYMGYALSAVIVARILYGFVGSDFAKFKQFLYHPVEIIQYMKTLLVGKGRAYLGHNPVGGIMVMVLLVTMTVQWGTGLFASDEIFWFGPFYGSVSDSLSSTFGMLHHTLPNILLALVALHILAVLYHELRFKERLVAAMLHGKKPNHSDATHEVSTPRFGVVVSLGVALVWLAWLWNVPV